MSARREQGKKRKKILQIIVILVVSLSCLTAVGVWVVNYTFSRMFRSVISSMTEIREAGSADVIGQGSSIDDSGGLTESGGDTDALVDDVPSSEGTSSDDGDTEASPLGHPFRAIVSLSILFLPFCIALSSK